MGYLLQFASGSKDKNLEDIKLCESVIYEREAYKNSFSNGLGILEFLDENSKAYQDFNNFFDELVEYVNRLEAHDLASQGLALRGAHARAQRRPRDHLSCHREGLRSARARVRRVEPCESGHRASR